MVAAAPATVSSFDHGSILLPGVVSPILTSMSDGIANELILRLAGEDDPRRRRLIALGMLTARLASDDIEPILVGGGALEYYTAGGYATTDMDLALPVAAEVDAAFADLGFTKEGRYWYNDELDLLFEAPAPAGLPGEDSPRTTAEVDGRWARRLAGLYRDRMDWTYLRTRTDALPEEADALEQVYKASTLL